MGMPQPHQERVIIEQAELAARLEKLAALIQSQTFDALPTIERELLLEQYILVLSYIRVLDKRIALFPPDIFCVRDLSGDCISDDPRCLHHKNI